MNRHISRWRNPGSHTYRPPSSPHGSRYGGSGMQRRRALLTGSVTAILAWLVFLGFLWWNLAPR
jgi:hypothetical protein